MDHNEYWNRCSICGQFISFSDLNSGAAFRRDTTPPGPYMTGPIDPEDYKTFHKKCWDGE